MSHKGWHSRHYLPHFDSQDVTARQANQQLKRSGPFWQTEYWDRFIRSETHFAAAENYIDQNPVKAGLIACTHLWPYGSARLKA
jgi:REP element-mobilizing transposase RayT